MFVEVLRLRIIHEPRLYTTPVTAEFAALMTESHQAASETGRQDNRTGGNRYRTTSATALERVKN